MASVSKSLIIISKAQGWDPTRIWDPKSRSYGESIENFDMPTEIFTNQAGTGKLPQDIPDTFPEAEQPKYPVPGPVDFENPPRVLDATRGTKNADPTPGGGY